MNFLALRFWTLFEAWLSMQSVTSEGLLPARENEQRSTIECIHNADMKYDGEKLKETWKSKTPDEAYDVLSKNDIQVTNQKDKETQLLKLSNLNQFASAQYSLLNSKTSEQERLTRAAALLKTWEIGLTA